MYSSANSSVRFRCCSFISSLCTPVQHLVLALSPCEHVFVSLCLACAIAFWLLNLDLGHSLRFSVDLLCLDFCFSYLLPCVPSMSSSVDLLYFGFLLLISAALYSFLCLLNLLEYFFGTVLPLLCVVYFSLTK